MERAAETRGLRVGLIAPPWVPVPPTVYGGTELVVDHLARGLQAAGCDVTLFTTGDATCPVPRRWLHRKALGTVAAPRGEREHVEQAYRDLAGVDLIHDHTVAGPAAVDLHPPGTPVVTTAHGELTPEFRRLYANAAAAGVAVVAISHAQRRSGPEVPFSAVIHHGIDPARFPFGCGGGGYVLFLGRMSPDKGAHRAIDIARAAGRRILLAAKMWEPDERRYFREVVEPRLGPDAVFVGEVGGRHKLDLLAGAEALVNPIRWPEPFGLVMIEALACGTPVLSFPHGAAPEIVEHGVTGFLCDDEADMAARLREVGSLDRARCRTAAEVRWSSARMVDDHLALYRALMADHVVHLGCGSVDREHGPRRHRSPLRRERPRPAQALRPYSPGRTSAHHGVAEEGRAALRCAVEDTGPESLFLNRVGTTAEHHEPAAPGWARRSKREEERDMRTIDAVRRSGVGISPERTVHDAAVLMEKAGVGALAVVDGDRLVGIVTDRDLVRRAMARGLAPEARVDAVMTSPVVTIGADADLHEAFALFRANAVRRLAVLRDDQFIGMITVDDLLVDLAADLSDLARPVTAEVLFAHHDSPVPATT